MRRYSINRVTLGDEPYPAALAAIADAPAVLYCRGNMTLMACPCIAVVGTRRATDYGIQATRQCSDALVRAGMVIVSGLALGIDAVAHRTALDAGGGTIAVLGSGVDDATIGPRQNLSLARDILENDGLIISEYPDGFPANKSTFPARNRIISGLSRGVLVTEAAVKSGALITARLAAEQGRDVFAVPGSIYWPRSVGPNYLIRNGAMAVTDPDDLLQACGILAGNAAPRDVVSTSDPVHGRIVAILDDGPAHVDAIIAGTELSASHVMAALSQMELTGTVIGMEGGNYRRA